MLSLGGSFSPAARSANREKQLVENRGDETAIHFDHAGARHNPVKPSTCDVSACEAGDMPLQAMTWKNGQHL